MRHPDYPFWSFLGFVAVLLPAAWHWRARNISTLAIITWLALGNLSLFVNTLIWADNYEDRVPVWCDISSRLFSAISFAMPACSLSQMRKLESVASTRHTILSAKARKRRIWEEVILCFVVPLAMLPLLYVVQGHRYQLIESLGPGGVPLFPSWPSIVVAYVTPSLIALVALVYAVLAIRWFLVRRLQFRSILAATDHHLTVDRYLRLIALAVGDAILLLSNIAVQAGFTFSNVAGLQLAEYKDWDTVHAGFSVISQFPEETLAPPDHTLHVVSFYIIPIYSFMFFTFFGLSEEAVGDYVRALHRCRAFGVRLGIISAIPPPNPNDGLLPTLGSKVVPVHGAAWAAQSPTEARSFPNEQWYRESDSEAVNGPAKGKIGVTVERTVL